MKRFVSTHISVIRFILVATALIVALNLIVQPHAQKQGARTETSMRYDTDGSLITTETDFDAQNRTVEKREIKDGKVRKRIHFDYPKGFTKPNTKTTEYGPDGKTPISIHDNDLDAKGNPTMSVTTTYDANGKETGGSKRETDPKTGKEHCYNWNPSKQVYEEVECPKKPWVSSVDTDNAKVETGGGLIKVNFNVEGGRVIVNLPDDMRAGDTISGTVTEEPNHKNLIDDNAFFVRQMYLDLLGRQPGPGDSQFWISTVGEKSSAPFPIKFTVEFPQIQPIPIILRDKDGNELGSVTIPIITRPIWFIRDQATPTDFRLPELGQQGRPLEIFGPFDGNSSNTTVRFGPPGSTMQDFEKNTENVSGGFGLIRPLAESPRKCVFESPPNVTGPVEVMVKEGGTTKTGTMRNVGVNLTAPNTNLQKGEKTTLKVEVTGLEGLKKPVPLTLTYGGTINMEGGNYQPLMIQPSEVSADGRYRTTRGITGIRAGGWNATATVVTGPFDFCLQDDSVPARVILWNTFTGDYIFNCPGCLPPKPQQGGSAGPAGTSGASGEKKTGEAAQPGTTTTVTATQGIIVPPLTGTGTVTRKGCIITLTDNRIDRRIFASLDPCTSSGTATVEAPGTKTKFTITDRNMKDNTCASPPPK